MPKAGQEPIRRDALTAATIDMLHERGIDRVTVGDIARAAGVSTALAHHYFGAKDDLLIAAMRRLLDDLSGGIVARLRLAEGPRARLSALLAGSFAADQFRAETVSAWLAFYALARNSPRAQRLLSIYHRRLDDNLRHALRPLVGDEAPAASAAIAALVDGFWLRQALSARPVDATATLAAVERAADALLVGFRR